MKKKGFTLLELIVCVIIVSIMVTIAIPQYRTAIRKRQEQDAVMQLMAIYAANSAYRGQNGKILQGNNLSLTQINDGFKINIIANDKTFSYSNVDGFAFTATAQYNKVGNSFTVGVNEGPLVRGGINPYCASGVGTCPSL